MSVLFPDPAKKYRGIKPGAVGSAQRVTERTGVTEEIVVRKNHVLLAIPTRRSKMKNHLRMFGLVLCMLPTHLHAGTAQDLQPVDKPAQGQNTRSAQPIPVGTILPVSLN